MFRAISHYTNWLHTGWPAGRVERLPVTRDDGSTNIPGVYIVGDLKGIPLLKFSVDSGAKAVRTILSEPGFAADRTRKAEGVFDLAIVGAGVSGVSAAIEARRAGLAFTLLESSEAFSTIVNFPRGKPIYTYPPEMEPEGGLKVTGEVKEVLLEELRTQAADAGISPLIRRVERVMRRKGHLELITARDAPGAADAEAGENPGTPPEPIRAIRVILALGRSGNYRRLGIPGEETDKVCNRLHDPKDYAGQDVCVTGGGDSALETAVALAEAGARVTLTYRGAGFSRPKQGNVDRLRGLEAGGGLRVILRSTPVAIREREIDIRHADGGTETIPNDVVFPMIGREAPLDFFRRSGVRVRGDWTASRIITLVVALAVCVFVYHWKTDSILPIQAAFKRNGWFPFSLPFPSDPASLAGTIGISMRSPGFYYSLVYCACVIGFGLRRIARRRTPYVTAQTWTLIAVQTIPLFLLPYIVLPWMGHNGWFDGGAAGRFADEFFPRTRWDPQGREYWRTLGFILAWPLFFWNVFTDQPMRGWLAVSAVQTFVLIPGIIYVWGKGAYCGWICSCGALAETMGDAHRHKMPHGPGWNRLNMLGQAVLLFALALLALRIGAWISGHDSAANRFFKLLFEGKSPDGRRAGFPMNMISYVWSVDLLMAGILGVGLYWHFSGRVWCRFACPLAALMHIYARFSRFGIIPEKKKCISCNVCTSVCHQGIDVMNFANKGDVMRDPECVRCSACVQSCPTGVLEFGRVASDGRVLGRDRLSAAPARTTGG